MTNVFPLILPLFVGGCAGALFFEGLWRTVLIAAQAATPRRQTKAGTSADLDAGRESVVRRNFLEAAVVNTRPVPLFVLSFTVRTMLLLVILWLVSRGNAFRLAACMMGVLLGRAVILQIHRGGKEVAD